MGGIPAPIFMAMFGGRMGGMPFGMGGIPFGPGMGGFDDDDEEGFFGGRFDDAWEEREEKRRQEENEEQAEILGVPVDADAKTIKTKCKTTRAYSYICFCIRTCTKEIHLTECSICHFFLLSTLSPLQIDVLPSSITQTSGARTASTA